jgi:hypothetical protein
VAELSLLLPLAFALVLIMALIGTVALKLLAPQLTVWQCFSMAFVAWAIATGVVVVLFLGILQNLQLPRELNRIGSIVSLCVYGYATTRLAERHGIRKTGRFGIGAKAALIVLALSWILALAGYALYYALS